MSIDYESSEAIKWKTSKACAAPSEQTPAPLQSLIEAMHNKIAALAEMVSMLETTCAYVTNENEMKECENKALFQSTSPAGRLVEGAIMDIETQIQRLDRLRKRLNL